MKYFMFKSAFYFQQTYIIRKRNYDLNPAVQCEFSGAYHELEISM